MAEIVYHFHFFYEQNDKTISKRTKAKTKDAQWSTVCDQKFVKDPRVSTHFGVNNTFRREVEIEMSWFARSLIVI